MMKIAALYANVPSRRLQSVQAYSMNLVPPSSRFSSAAARQRPFSLTLCERERDGEGVRRREVNRQIVREREREKERKRKNYTKKFERYTLKH